MMRSMISAASSIRFHQTFMDVVANNIANINTTGFKGGRVSFHELMSQVVSSGSAPQGERGGINPIQVGLGMILGGTDTIFTQGMLQSTGRSTDVAIQGDGFFVFQNPTGGQLYSRDGTLDLALDGSLVNPTTGMKVLGWLADANGDIDTTQPLDALQVGVGEGLVARPTTDLRMIGNLDASTALAGTVETSVQVYDSLGIAHSVTLTFEKTAVANTWSWAVTSTDPAITAINDPDAFPNEVVFDGSDGSVAAGNDPVAIELVLNTGATTPQTFTFDLSTMTQLQADSNVNLSWQDGMAAGSLVSFGISTSGEVMGVNSNGLRRTLGQIALASFLNPTALIKQGNNMYDTSSNSGEPNTGTAGSGQRGTLTSGFLEMSNVELAQQFTDMIRAQRGFQANSRVISASDQMLQDLVNLAR